MHIRASAPQSVVRKARTLWLRQLRRAGAVSARKARFVNIVMDFLGFVAIFVICCFGAAVVPQMVEWLRACWILRRMPGPKGGILGQLKYFNDHSMGQHKSVIRWARKYGSIYRVRLANVNVSLLGLVLLLLHWSFYPLLLCN